MYYTYETIDSSCGSFETRNHLFPPTNSWRSFKTRVVFMGSVKLWKYFRVHEPPKKRTIPLKMMTWGIDSGVWATLDIVFSVRSILIVLLNTNCPCSVIKTKGMFPSWTMKSSLVPLKYVIGCWTRPGTTSVYIKEKNAKGIMEFEVLKRFIFTPTLSIVMVQRVLQWERRKRFFLLQMSEYHRKENFFWKKINLLLFLSF